MGASGNHIKYPVNPVDPVSLFFTTVSISSWQSKGTPGEGVVRQIHKNFGVDFFAYKI